jgi:hypothetical protein
VDVVFAVWAPYAPKNTSPTRAMISPIQDVLPETEREESMVGTLRAERRGATATGS